MKIHAILVSLVQEILILLLLLQFNELFYDCIFVLFTTLQNFGIPFGNLETPHFRNFGSLKILKNGSAPKMGVAISEPEAE